MPTLFDKIFLGKEEELNKKIAIWVKEEQSKYDDDKGYLGNKVMIEKSRMFDLATRAPKGGHLHIHFNSCLEPDFLLKRAQDEEVRRWMYISLPEHQGPLKRENYQDVKKVKFHFMTSAQHQQQIDDDQRLLIKGQPVNVVISNIFGPNYGVLTPKKRKVLETKKIEEEKAGIKAKEDEIQDIAKKIARKQSQGTVDKECKWFEKKRASLIGQRDKAIKDSKDPFEKRIKLDERMLFSDFLAKFEEKKIGPDAMTWLQQRLVFSSNDITSIYPDKKGTVETCAKQWRAFDSRTQMMAGLFNTEHVYRRYTAKLLETLQAENIQYAEIRPNFMSKNQVYGSQDPTKLKSNEGIMDMIIEEYEAYQARQKRLGKPQFGGLKVIYCTPRVFKKDEIEWALDECLKMKKADKYRNYIAGFDIIGPENAPNPLSFFKEELQEFQTACGKAGIKCPFLFHAGESHSDPNGNLDVALELNAKRIAHGYAIPRKSSVLGNVKRRGQSLCIECCPISNQILGLHPFAGQAVVYDLMEANIPCALASDNPTLFSSVLAHDFYQFMIAKKNFRLQHWRQLMQDSLKHAVWNSPQEFERVFSIWERAYVKFVIDILKEIMEAQARPAGNGNPQRTTTSQAAIREEPTARSTKQPIQGGNQNTLASRSGPPTTIGQTQRRPDGQASAPVPGRGGPQPQRKVTNNTAATTSGASKGAVGSAAPRTSSSSTPTTISRGPTGMTAASTSRQAAAGGDASRARPSVNSINRTQATNSQAPVAKSPTSQR